MADVSPTRTSYDVRSTITGAVVIADVPKRIAEREAERLNGEARQVVGRRPARIAMPDGSEQPNPDAGRPVYAGEQGGSVTGYEVVRVDRADEDVVADGLESEVPRARALRDRLQGELAAAKDADRDRLADQVRGIERSIDDLQRQAAETRERGKRRRDAEKAMQA